MRICRFDTHICPGGRAIVKVELDCTLAEARRFHEAFRDRKNMEADPESWSEELKELVALKEEAGV